MLSLRKVTISHSSMELEECTYPHAHLKVGALAVLL